MSSREKILREIAQNKPATSPLPAPFFIEKETHNPVQKFLEVLHSVGGTGQIVNGWDEVHAHLQQQISKGAEVVNGIQNLAPCNIENYSSKEVAEVQDVHTVFLQGGIAIAENAAVWLSEKKMVNRLLPFICQQLILVIDEKEIVANMHEAYDKITIDEDGYGVFIAGPSKTADIEQSLVIGAHGPLELHVFVMKLS